MVLACCVCKKKWKTGDSTIFHPFPTGENEKQEWLRILGRSRESKWWRVCSDHFEPENYTFAIVSGKRRLKKNARPCLKLEKRDDVPFESSITFQRIDSAVENFSIKNEIIEIFEQSENIDFGSVPLHSQDELDQENCATKRKSRSSIEHVWANFDEEFLKYKRIKDVNWTNVVSDSTKATMCWEVAVETLHSLEKENKQLRSRVKSLEGKLSNLQGLVKHLKEKKHK